MAVDADGARERIAAFDVDGTLTSRDCVVPFLRRTAGTPRIVAGLLRHPLALTAALARRDRDRVKALATRAAFARRRIDEVRALGVEFAEEVAGEHLRPDIVARLTAHRTAGDTVVLVSASYEVYLEPLAELLRADAVLATRLAVGADGRLSGDLDGPNCRAGEKVRRLDRWLGGRGESRDSVHLTAYGDSAGDRQLLLDADVAHWVGRGPAPTWMPRT